MLFFLLRFLLLPSKSIYCLVLSCCFASLFLLFLLSNCQLSALNLFSIFQCCLQSQLHARIAILQLLFFNDFQLEIHSVYLAADTSSHIVEFFSDALFEIPSILRNYEIEVLIIFFVSYSYN